MDALDRLDSISRRELSQRVAANILESGRNLDDVVDTVIIEFLDVLATELGAGHSVNLRGFGTFEPRRMEARTHRRPDTGEKFTKPAQRRVLFRPSSNLKVRVNATGA